MEPWDWGLKTLLGGWLQKSLTTCILSPLTGEQVRFERPVHVKQACLQRVVKKEWLGVKRNWLYRLSHLLAGQYLSFDREFKTIEHLRKLLSTTTKCPHSRKRKTGQGVGLPQDVHKAGTTTTEHEVVCFWTTGASEKHFGWRMHVSIWQSPLLLNLVPLQEIKLQITFTWSK